jgi:hypothetical protein
MADETKAVEKTEKAKTRRTYRNDQWTEEDVKAKKAALTLAEVPAGWVKLADVSTACRANGIPVSKFVRAFGGDRGMNAPIAPEFRFVYVGRTRYCPPEALTTGIAKLKDPSFLKTTRVHKPKADKPAKTAKAEAAPVPEGRRVAVRPQS